MVNSFKLKFLCFIISIVLILSTSISVFALPVSNRLNSSVNDCINNIIKHKRETVNAYENGNLFNKEFLMKFKTEETTKYLMSLSRLGYNDDYTNYYYLLKEYINDSYKQSDNGFENNKISLNYKLALSILSCGENPQKIEYSDKTIDLINDGIYNRTKADFLGKSGIWDLSWALIVLNSADFTTYEPTNDTTLKIINSILDSQNEEGVFDDNSNSTQWYDTAFCVVALAPYVGNSTLIDKTQFIDEFGNNKIDLAVYNALDFLSKKQGPNGDFPDAHDNNISVTSSVITALCSLKIDPEKDSRFIKNPNTLINGLLKKVGSSGVFEDEKNNSNALMALSAYKLLKEEYKTFFDFRNVKIQKNPSMSLHSLSIYEQKHINNIKNRTSTDDYIWVSIAINRIKNSPIFIDKEEKLQQLYEIKNEIFSKYSTIQDVNLRAANAIYSKNFIYKSTNNDIIDLYAECESLSPHDQNQISLYDDLCVQYNLVRTRRVILIILFSIILLTLLVLLIIVSKLLFSNYLMPRAKRNMIIQKNLDENDEDFDREELSFGEDDEDDEELLPCENDIDFFDYYNGDEIMFQNVASEENSPLPFEENEEFFNYNQNNQNGFSKLSFRGIIKESFSKKRNNK